MAWLQWSATAISLEFSSVACGKTYPMALFFAKTTFHRSYL
jgi:hypothetical protein